MPLWRKTLVFLAMVNEVATEMQHRWKYVDDITVAEVCDPKACTPPNGTQDAMDAISSRADNDHMSLNVGKCAVMQCAFSKRVPPPPVVSANDKTVPTVTTLTLLGVTLTPTLKWDQHVDSLVNKANSKGFFLAVLRRSGVTPSHLISFYITFIRPTLEYAAPVWHPGLPQHLSNQLETAQRLCLRSIYPDLSYRA